MQRSWLAALEAGETDALPTIEQLGAIYGEALAAHAGSKPCVVAGYCLGGKIAFEAARALQRAGGNVAFVLILDARAYTSSSYTLGPAWESLAQIWRGTLPGKAEDGFFRHRWRAALRDTGVVIRFLLSRLPASVIYRRNVIKARLDKMRNRPAPPILPSGYFDEEGQPTDTLVINRLALRMARLWRPQPLDAAGVLIRADNLVDMLPGTDPGGGWDGLFGGGFEVIQTTGDHLSMMTDQHAVALARQMEAVLDRYEISGDESMEVLDSA
jgi:thioesterase domain-containing protein